jgi:hypothetical protein
MFAWNSRMSSLASRHQRPCSGADGAGRDVEDKVAGIPGSNTKARRTRIVMGNRIDSDKMERR